MLKFIDIVINTIWDAYMMILNDVSLLRIVK